jgi:eukaryotic-like serine/threonine-protein kinase
VSQIIGKYEVQGILGEGGMAVVYKAHDTVLDRDVALKVIQQFHQEGERARRRFLNEAKAAAALTHPNIVTVYELGEDGAVPYIAMEYLPGEDLAHYIATGALTLAQKLEVARQVALGLEHAHSRSVIHRDIKPRNIKLLPDLTAKLMDFGIAKLASEHLTKTGQAVGTPSYMSPEQILGETVTPASDVFSFGVVLYELLSGTLPFGGENLQDLIGAIVGVEPRPLRIDDPAGPELSALVMRCLAKPLGERYDTFAPVLSDLKRIVRTRSSEASVEPSPPPIPGQPAADTKTPRRLIRVGDGLGEFTQTGQVRTPVEPIAIPDLSSAETPTQGPPASTKRGISPMFVFGLILLAIITGLVLRSFL